ncbi:MAG TPA: DNA recombination protein RmuC [Acetobacteraceae bacterium]|nr:DNA recombination protein RmuC [Acetobacteraceae bacterium]
MPVLIFYIAAALTVGLLVIVTCLLMVVVRRLRGDGNRNALVMRIDASERLMRDDNEALRSRLIELDQGLRKEVSVSTRDGFERAFDKVQEGSRAQSQALQESISRVQQAMSDLSERVTSGMTEMKTLLAEKLADAERSAAEGRAALLRDTAESIVRAREGIDGSLKVFGDQQAERLGRMEEGVKASGEASQAHLKDIRTVVGAAGEKTEKTLTEQRETVLAHLTTGQTQVSEKLTKDLSGLMEKVTLGFDGFTLRLREEQERLRGQVDAKLGEMRAGNEAKLEEMRKAVDEKLQSALEKQLGESFQRVAEQFAAVQQAVGQVQSVAGQVGDLKRLFSNVKSRGGWGEAQIDAMLGDILAEGSYERNKRMREGSGEAVEFAVRVPNRGGEPVWLPIDSKFPTESYDRLLQANEDGNRDEEIAARAALERTIRMEAQRIASKYIVPPLTVEFAVLYLPTDSLFAEVARSPGLIERVRNEHRIMVMGPSLLPAFLHTIRVGQMTMALEQKTAEIGHTLSAVKSEWDKLGKVLDGLASNAERLSRGIENTRTRTRVIGRKLRSVAELDYVDAARVLGLDAPTLEAEAEDIAEDQADAAG